ncbi:hypothetical protein GW17_00045055 [Ensete ventricosum]|nr:hypothetical protein GW17_00045055 [Ensete ventricosum]
MSTVTPNRTCPLPPLPTKPTRSTPISRHRLVLLPLLLRRICTPSMDMINSSSSTASVKVGVWRENIPHRSRALNRLTPIATSTSVATASARCFQSHPSCCHLCHRCFPRSHLYRSQAVASRRCRRCRTCSCHKPLGVAFPVAAAAHPCHP